MAAHVHAAMILGAAAAAPVAAAAVHVELQTIHIANESIMLMRINSQAARKTVTLHDKPDRCQLAEKVTREN